MALFSGTSSDKRPVFLDLTKIYLPRTALVSILHRVSGIAMILSLPILAWVLYLCVDISMHSVLHGVVASIWYKLFVFLVIIGFAYHWLAGVRHLLADMFDAHNLALAKLSADTVLITWLLWVVFVVYMVWLS